MSIVLINVIGFSISTLVIVTGAISLYKESQKEEPEEDYIDGVSPEPRNINADVLGLSVEIARYGIEAVERKTDALFENRAIKNLSWKLLEPFQIQPDGNYFKSPAAVAWEGYDTEEREIPVYRLGKFEMLI